MGFEIYKKKSASDNVKALSTLVKSYPQHMFEGINLNLMKLMSLE